MIRSNERGQQQRWRGLDVRSPIAGVSWRTWSGQDSGMLLRRRNKSERRKRIKLRLEGIQDPRSPHLEGEGTRGGFHYGVVGRRSWRSGHIGGKEKEGRIRRNPREEFISADGMISFDLEIPTAIKRKGLDRYAHGDLLMLREERERKEQLRSNQRDQKGREECLRIRETKVPMDIKSRKGRSVIYGHRFSSEEKDGKDGLVLLRGRTQRIGKPDELLSKDSEKRKQCYRFSPREKRKWI
ncbi:hypothetical protein NPIL_366261 [Nephila pilipes]|uniref:Uncharacterized protein n=1 Tax=Nephila pilipes TaxID=299642 RepID=A0A8X6MYX6_NEPPI|nr:hypothetical protein NPIL_366261 [Nephila pilipes]